MSLVTGGWFSSVLMLGMATLLIGMAGAGRPGAQELGMSPGGLLAPGSYEVTLITGERASVDVLPDGRLTVAPDDDSGGVAYQTFERGADLYLFPSSAAGLVPDPLDMELFNLRKLIAHGYHDTGTGALPVTIDGAPTLLTQEVASRLRQSGALGEGGVGSILLDGDQDATPPTVAADTTPAPNVPRYLLTFELTRRDGTEAGGFDSLAVLNLEDSDRFGEFVMLGQRILPLIFLVPEGTYGATLTTWEDDGVAVTSTPQFEVDDHTEVTLDAADAVETTLDVTTSETLVDHDLSGWAHVPQAGEVFSSRMWSRNLDKAYAAPTAPVTVGGFEVSRFWRLASPEGATDPHVLDLLFIEDDGVPESLDYVVGEDELAQLTQVDVSLHSNLAEGHVRERRPYWRPWETVALSSLRTIDTPSTRTDYITPGDSHWHQNIITHPRNRMMWTPRTQYPLPGEQHTQTWLRQPIVTGVLDRGGIDQDLRLRRSGDVLHVRLPDFTDADGNWGWRSGPPPGAGHGFFLYDDDTGEELGRYWLPRGEYELPPRPVRLRMEVELDRGLQNGEPWDGWLMSPRVDTTWWVHSDRPGDGVTDILPLVVVDYDIDLDRHNTVRAPGAGEPLTIDLRPRHQRGADGSAIEEITLSTSFDDGATWTSRDADRQEDGSFRFRLDPLQDQPEGSTGYVSLRVEAWDADGNGVRQQIIRAFALPTGEET